MATDEECMAYARECVRLADARACVSLCCTCCIKPVATTPATNLQQRGRGPAHDLRDTHLMRASAGVSLYQRASACISMHHQP
jgi:hypothetical protein